MILRVLTFLLSSDSKGDAGFCCVVGCFLLSFGIFQSSIIYSWVLFHHQIWFRKNRFSTLLFSSFKWAICTNLSLALHWGFCEFFVVGYAWMFVHCWHTLIVHDSSFGHVVGSHSWLFPVAVFSHTSHGIIASISTSGFKSVLNLRPSKTLCSVMLSCSIYTHALLLNLGINRVGFRFSCLLIFTLGSLDQ